MSNWLQERLRFESVQNSPRAWHCGEDGFSGTRDGVEVGAESLVKALTLKLELRLDWTILQGLDMCFLNAKLRSQ